MPCSVSGAAPKQDCASLPRPRLYLYPECIGTPPWQAADSARLNWLWLALRKSEYRVTDGACADFFFLSNYRSATKSSERVATLLNKVAAAYPYWNATSRRHLILMPCDHGPGDCMWKRNRAVFTGVPDAANGLPGAAMPFSSPSRRSLGFVTYNGDPGRWNVFAPGLDVRLPSHEMHECGPFCGLHRLPPKARLAALRRHSPWYDGRMPAQRSSREGACASAAASGAWLSAPRRIELFFAGRPYLATSRHISPHPPISPTSPHISPHLPASPHISPHLPYLSRHISPYLPTSPRKTRRTTLNRRIPKGGPRGDVFRHHHARERFVLIDSAHEV